MSTDKPKGGPDDAPGGQSSPQSSRPAPPAPDDPDDAEHHSRHFSTDHLLGHLKGRTISSGLITVLSQGVQFVLTMASTVVLARMLPPADFGLVAMVLAVLGYFRIFNDAGLSVATIQRQDITHAQVSNLFWINVALSTVAGLIFAASAPAIAWFYREPQLVTITVALAATFILSGLNVQNMALLNRQMRFKAIAMIQIISMLASIIMGVGMAWLNYGYWSLVAMQLGAPFVTLLLTWSASGWRPQYPARQAGTRPLLHFGANFAASNLIYSIARGIDAPLVGRTYGADAVGLYSRAAVLLHRPLQQFLSPINAVFVPVLSRLQGDTGRYHRIFLQVYEAIALIGFLFSGLLLPLAYPLTLVLLGPQWKEAAPIFAGFAILAISYPLTDPCNWLFASQGRGKDWLRASLFASVLSVLAFIAGLPFGPAGVAIAYSATSVLIILPVYCYLAGQRGPIGAMDLLRTICTHVPIWGVVCGTTYFVRTMTVDHAPWVQLLISIPTGLSSGALFISVYPPARRTVRNLLNALQVLRSPGTANPT